MSENETIYEVDESNLSPRFLDEELMKEEYPILYKAIEEWDATFLNVKNVNGGAMVKTHPHDMVVDDQIETL